MHAENDEVIKEIAKSRRPENVEIITLFLYYLSFLIHLGINPLIAHNTLLSTSDNISILRDVTNIGKISAALTMLFLMLRKKKPPLQDYSVED